MAVSVYKLFHCSRAFSGRCKKFFYQFLKLKLSHSESFPKIKIPTVMFGHQGRPVALNMLNLTTVLLSNLPSLAVKVCCDDGPILTQSYWVMGLVIDFERGRDVCLEDGAATVCWHVVVHGLHPTRLQQLVAGQGFVIGHRFHGVHSWTGKRYISNESKLDPEIHSSRLDKEPLRCIITVIYHSYSMKKNN